MAVEAGFSVSSLISVLQLFIRSRDASVEEQTAAGSIPSARLIVSVTAQPPYSFYLQLGPSRQARTADGRRREMVGFKDKETKKKRCLTLDSGRLLFLAKAAIITRATSNKIVQARLGN